mmetsp:Transcript_64431/g.163295  ORF Transcript_64431/g.163295 Transcript_64431/m.163295 type:complete len:202 (-) Transcript_64431:25-630(-)
MSNTQAFLASRELPLEISGLGNGVPKLPLQLRHGIPLVSEAVGNIESLGSLRCQTLSGGCELSLQVCNARLGGLQLLLAHLSNMHVLLGICKPSLPLVQLCSKVCPLFRQLLDLGLQRFGASVPLLELFVVAHAQLVHLLHNLEMLLLGVHNFLRGLALFFCELLGGDCCFRLRRLQKRLGAAELGAQGLPLATCFREPPR